MVSNSDEDAFEAAKPEAPNSFAVHLDSALTFQTKKRHMSKILLGIKKLRTKYTIMGNMWLLSKMRTRGRALFADFRRTQMAKIP